MTQPLTHSRCRAQFPARTLRKGRAATCANGRCSRLPGLSGRASGVARVRRRRPRSAPPVGFTADDCRTWQPNGMSGRWPRRTAGLRRRHLLRRPPARRRGAGSEQPAVNFAALDAATGAPTSCKLSFTVGGGTATVRALAVSPDKQTLYAGGYFGAVNGTPVSSLAAIDIATCTVKPALPPGLRRHRAGPRRHRRHRVRGRRLPQRRRPARASASRRSTPPPARCSPSRANADDPGRRRRGHPDGQNALLGGDFFTVDGTNTHALPSSTPPPARSPRPTPASSTPTRHQGHRRPTGDRLLHRQRGHRRRCLRRPHRASASPTSTSAGATTASAPPRPLPVHRTCSTAARTPTTAPAWASTPTASASTCSPSRPTTRTCWAGAPTPTTASARASARA